MDKTFLIRLMQEVKELAGKNTQLEAYLGNDFNRDGVSPEHWAMLERQKVIMEMYQDILEDRLIDLIANSNINLEQLKYEL